MLDFALGFIAGLLMSLVVLVVSIHLKGGKSDPISRLATKIEKAKKSKDVHIIEGMNPVEETRADIIEENDANGRDTRLQDL